MSHTSQSQSKSGVQPVAVFVGVVLSLVGLACAGKALWSAFDIVGSALLIVLSLYIAGSVATFWFARLWEDGLTVNELIMLVVWPREIRNIMKAGVKNGFSSLAIDDDDSDVWIENENLAQVVGVVFSIFALLLAVPLFIEAFVGALGSVLMLLVYLHITGAAVYFWMAGFHKKPLSGGTFVETALWEVDLFRDLWAKAKQQNNPAA